MTHEAWTWKVPVYAQGEVAGFALVDAADFDAVASVRWRMHPAGYACRSGPRPPTLTPGQYRSSPTILLHRQLMAAVLGVGLAVDHINRNRLDCRRSNLRVVPAWANNQNTDARPPRANRAARTSRHRGVAWHKGSNKWRAVVQVNGRQRHLGYFMSEDAAAVAARTFRAEHLPFSID